jgi:hypothetical protein
LSASQTAEELAQKWANKCTFNHRAKHQLNTKDGKFGENLYVAIGEFDPTNETDVKRKLTAAVDSWFNEGKDNEAISVD